MQFTTGHISASRLAEGRGIELVVLMKYLDYHSALEKSLLDCFKT